MSVVIYPMCNDRVAHLAGVKRHLRSRANGIAKKATALLEQHRQTGSHQIEVTSGDVDAYVTMTGRAPFNVEFGRPDNPDSGEGGMEGLYILSRASGLRA